MTQRQSHRARYLRRAIPRLSEKCQPRYVIGFPPGVTAEQMQAFKDAMTRSLSKIAAVSKPRA